MKLRVLVHFEALNLLTELTGKPLKAMIRSERGFDYELAVNKIVDAGFFPVEQFQNIRELMDGLGKYFLRH